VAFYLCTALGTAVAFVLGWRVGRRGRRAAIAGYVVAVLLLLGKGVLNHRPDWEHALFPWPDWVFFQGWLLYPLGLLCLGLATGLLPRERGRTAVVVLAAFLFLVSLWTERWIVTEPDGSSDARAGADHHCAQSTGHSCGPAACVSLLSYHGVDATEGEMMRLCRTPDRGGTSLFRIRLGLAEKLPGHDVDIVDGDPDSLRGRGAPAIVSVHRLHVVTVRFDGDAVVVHDPALPAPHRIPFDEYRARFGGFAVVAEAR
jgi:hypothetical protein